jgi:Metallo-peptidase family M12/Domain of unknown function DUF11
VYGGEVVTSSNSTTRLTAKMLFDSIVKDAGAPVTAPDLELTLGVVADYEFYQLYSDDPEGTIIARMDIVDGIWSSQVGVKISLAPLTVLKSANEPFTKTAPSDLLSQLRQYRTSHSAQQLTGATHLMTGRDLDGDIVGIAYMGTICDGQSADSLSEGAHSTLMSALIAAHELAHNFNAPHDGEAGACSTTPQTFLMAPKLNFSQQFSSCSLEQINSRIKTAACLAPYTAPDVAVELPATQVSAVENTPFTISFVVHALGDDPSNDVSALASFPANLTVRAATVAGGSCSIDGGSVTCPLGQLLPKESRQIDVTIVGNTTDSSDVVVSVTSPNDYVMDNNSAQISIQLSATTPSTAPVTGGNSNSNGGSGGGGSLDLVVLGLLGCAAATSIYHRQRFQ